MFALCADINALTTFRTSPPRHIMRFKFHDVDFKPGFHGVDIRFDNHSDVDAAKAHTDKTSH
jgi:hypothetical protein